MRSAGDKRVLLAVMLAAPGVAGAQDVSVQLRFDGKPLTTRAAPKFSCLDRNRNTWIDCRISREPGPMANFAVEHFFSFNQRTDNCANCKVGDTAADMVRDLAEAGPAEQESSSQVTTVVRF